MAKLKRSEQLAAMADSALRDPRPEEHFAAFHERSRTREPDGAYEAVRILTMLWAFMFFRVRSISSEKVPQSGPLIFAPNHGSFMDHFFLGAFVRRKVRFMAKSQLFQPPAQFVYSHGGVFPVRRGHRDEEAFITAGAILDRGGAVAMYCEGSRSRDGKLSDRPKPGIGRLALESGVPIVPVAIHGSSRVRDWRRGKFPKVTLQYGDPIRFEQVLESTRDQQMAVAEEIFNEIRVLHSGLETLGRKGVLQRVREQRRSERRGKKRAATA